MYKTLTHSQDLTVRAFFTRTYTWMTAGLILTALTAWFTVSNPALLSFVSSTFLILFLAELGLVFYLSFAIGRMKATTAGLVFAGYAALNGLVLSGVFLAFAPAAIYSAFFTTAGTFLVMSVIGYTTKIDLTRFGSLLFMAVIGIFLAIIVNMFLKNSMLYMLISMAGVLIFTALIAYDTQRLRKLALYGPQAIATRRGGSILMGGGGGGTGSVGSPSSPAAAWQPYGGSTGEVGEKLAIFGALALYLDFINLFLFLLQLFGGGGRR